MSEDRALVDLMDVGENESVQHLQATFILVDGRASAFCFMRGLTLDYSLLRALVYSRRRYRDFVEISSGIIERIALCEFFFAQLRQAPFPLLEALLLILE